MTLPFRSDVTARKGRLRCGENVHGRRDRLAAELRDPGACNFSPRLASSCESARVLREIAVCVYVYMLLVKTESDHRGKISLGSYSPFA